MVAGQPRIELVPVTAKLSRKFYDAFGDDIANELVEWFNAVDLTYRSQLRELNDSNFLRFDARVGQRMAELEARMVERFTALETRLDREIASLRQEFTEFKGDVMKWMFIYWAGSTAATLGAIAAAVAILR